MTTSSSPLLRKAAASMPFTAAILGMAIVFGGITLFFIASSALQVVTIALGVFVILSGIWFASNPFLKNERRYTELRSEVDRFIQLARRLNRAAVENRSREEFEQAKAAMHESVERMAMLAGKEKTATEQGPPKLSVTNGSGTKQAAAPAG